MPKRIPHPTLAEWEERIPEFGTFIRKDIRFLQLVAEMQSVSNNDQLAEVLTRTRDHHQSMHAYVVDEARFMLDVAEALVFLEDRNGECAYYFARYSDA